MAVEYKINVDKLKIFRRHETRRLVNTLRNLCTNNDCMYATGILVSCEITVINRISAMYSYIYILYQNITMTLAIVGVVSAVSASPCCKNVASCYIIYCICVGVRTSINSISTIFLKNILFMYHSVCMS